TSIGPGGGPGTSIGPSGKANRSSLRAKCFGGGPGGRGGALNVASGASRGCIAIAIAFSRSLCLNDFAPCKCPGCPTSAISSTGGGVPVYTEPELEHVTILHVLQRVLVRTIRLLALPVLGVKSTRGHARLVELMQEPARVSFHAQVSQPVPADRLSGGGACGCVSFASSLSSKSKSRSASSSMA
ncbi:hypothetical protein BE221DRAFT_69745, partial [Ostreococcus tauri]